MFWNTTSIYGLSKIIERNRKLIPFLLPNLLLRNPLQLRKTKNLSQQDWYPQEKEPKSLHFNNKISVVILKAKFLEVQRAGERGAGEDAGTLACSASPRPAQPISVPSSGAITSPVPGS